jgi:putative NIF3 family GTP cyclohydrolase 1 type 2
VNAALNPEDPGDGEMAGAYSPSNIPIPDPSLITARVIAEVRAELREEFREALRAQQELLISTGVSRHEKAMLRIDAVERAAEVFEESLNRVPTVLDREVNRLEALFVERLNAVGIRIDTFHTLADALRANAKEAVAAALVALKEMTAVQHAAYAAAVDKGEAATTKEIDGIKLLISGTSKAFDTEISNLTDRLNRGEGALVGGKGVIGFIVGGVGLAGVVVTMLFHLANPVAPIDNSKRLDDLIAQTAEQNRQVGQRMDALSARLNLFTPVIPVPAVTAVPAVPAVKP